MARKESAKTGAGNVTEDASRRAPLLRIPSRNSRPSTRTVLTTGTTRNAA
eukprot:GSA120T00011506001.1